MKEVVRRSGRVPAQRAGTRPERPLWWAIAAVYSLVAPAAAFAQDAAIRGGGLAPDPQAEIIKKVRLDQKLNARVPLDITFRDETGRLVPLHQYFGRKPVMMNLIQYRCTNLCSVEMKTLAQSLKELQFTAGNQFNLLTVSIDDRHRDRIAFYGIDRNRNADGLEQSRRPAAECRSRSVPARATRRCFSPSETAVHQPDGRTIPQPFGQLFPTYPALQKGVLLREQYAEQTQLIGPSKVQRN